MRVLEVISALDNGGVENLMFNYCSRISNEFEFDFTTYDDKKGALEDRFSQIGGILRITQMRSNILKTIKTTKRYIKDGGYDVIHLHQGYLGFIALHYAIKYKVKGIVMHAHVAYVPEGKLGALTRRVLTRYCTRRVNNFMACSKDASEWMWGKNKNCIVMKNAVIPTVFDFDPSLRLKKRTELKLENAFVIGCVGRICYQKNPEFTLSIFKEVLKNKPNSMLLMVGNGDQENKMHCLASEMGISEKVMFLGSRNDVPELLNAMDVFLLPSRFEGLGIAYVEAQINGLKCYASLEGVPQEAAIDEDMEFISLNKSAEFWAEKICENDICSSRHGKVEEAKMAGYDIDIEAKKLASYYKMLGANDEGFFSN